MRQHIAWLLQPEGVTAMYMDSYLCGRALARTPQFSQGPDKYPAAGYTRAVGGSPSRTRQNDMCAGCCGL